MKVRGSRGFLRSKHVELESYSKLLGANIHEKILVKNKIIAIAF